MRLIRVVGMVTGVFLLASCAAHPGPPPVVEGGDSALVASSSAVPAPQEGVQRSQASVGVDALGGGFNPHLVANNSELVSQIARLVLPSPFRDGVLDSDLLDKAEEVAPPPGVAMRVVYTIASAAQWSDGSPISGADFIYLWNGMLKTPGVDKPAGYRAISAITTADGGRTVRVDFSQRVSDWKDLFDNLLPSHLLGDSSFDTALANDVPASAGRYKVVSVDRARGVITLNRNDRFWGKDPAHIDILYLNQVSSTEEGVDMLRSGQVGFADITPSQTTEESLSLLPGVTSAEVTRPRQLRVQLVLSDAAARRALAGLIDTAQVARLATGRETSLHVPDTGIAKASEVDVAPALDVLKALGHPVRIAVDPTDDTAARAATVVVDQLRARGVEAAVVSDKMSVITGKLLPAGSVDAVLNWEDTTKTSVNLANAFLCVRQQAVASAGAGNTESPESKANTGSVGQVQDGEGADPAPRADSAASDMPWAGNLTGYCDPHAEEIRADILDGKMSVEDVARRVDELNQQQRLWLPILDETRIHALGRGIVGPGTSVDSWSDGIVTAAEWNVSEN